MNKFIPFTEAHNIVKNLKLKNIDEWRKWIKENKEYNIPYNPDIYYKNNGWIDWKHFLNKKFKMNFITYEEAREILKKESIKNNIDFKKWINNNSNIGIPKAPEITYSGKGWISWGDFLSTNNQHSKNFFTYKEAILILSKLNLKSKKEYLKYIKENNINLLPTNPHIVYSEYWISMGEYLNSGVVSNDKKSFISYEKAQDIVREINIKSSKEYFNWNKPNNMPSNPVSIYDEYWISWGDFLGTKRKSQKEKSELFISFTDAKKYLKGLNLKHKFDYHEYIINNDIYFLPKRPDYVYKKEWVGYLDYLNCDGLRSSYGERRIKQFLDENNIIYEREKIFKSCKNNKGLPFDFYLPKFNTCIEYDGQHHFQSVSKYGGEDFLKKVKENDKIKTDWCLLNNIKLLRIPYNKKNKIYKILEKELFVK